MKKLNIFILFLSASILFSCDHLLDQVNPNLPTVDDHWNNADQAFAGATALYNALITDGAYMRTLVGAADSRGDDFKGDSPDVRIVQIGKFIAQSDQDMLSWIWRDMYILNFRANQVLTYVEGMSAEGEQRILEPAQKNRILGQAYFMRALAYFNLANNFQVVPLITALPQTEADYYPETATQDEIWAQIISDLQMAESLLPLDYLSVSGPDNGHIGRATAGAAAGLLGKVYVYRQMWTEAKGQFEKFFTGAYKDIYDLAPEYAHNFDEAHENNVESLFEVQFTTVGGTDHNWAGDPNANWKALSGLAVSYAMPDRGWSDYTPTTWIHQEYKKERTADGKLDPRLKITLASYEAEGEDDWNLAYGNPWFHDQDAVYCSKWTGNRIGYSDDWTLDISGGINYRVLRFADILLLYAETLNELGQTADAYPYIQRVRTRAGLADLATTMPGLSQDQMREQLYHERALEFAIEGQRIFDIIRWGWLYDSSMLEELKARDDDFETWVPGREYLPIPRTELDNNPNLSPNDANRASGN
ncbi:RagB/SusD family nutrient uptake outer membrane protein [Persicobacter diffluens]|uniref:Membrane protein n=1 Tax=Persicobacter diffluens TaxID=981 RepID=A0AAN4W449_9BACT|nr:membrane protein [Persicobacter diffluens]